MIVALLYFLSLVPVACMKGGEAMQAKRPGLVVGAVRRLAPTGVVCCLGSGLITSPFYSLAPVFAGERAFSTGEISYFMSAAMFGGMALQWPIGRLSDRINRRVVSMALARLGGACQLRPQRRRQPAARWRHSHYLFGGFMLALYRVGIAAANDRLPPEETVKASGALILVWSRGAMIGPVSAAAFMHRFGAGGLFIFTGVIATGLTVFVLARLVMRPGKAIPVPRRSGPEADLS